MCRCVPVTTGPGGGFNYSVAGRLKEGIAIARANAEASSVFESFRGTHPESLVKTEYAAAFVPFQSSMARYARPALLLLLGAVGMLLLIACANTANLLLAKATARGREIAVRAALGAGRARLIRQLLTESVVLFILGGTIGVVCAYWAVPALLTMTPSTYTVYQDARVDLPVLTTMLAVSLATGLLFGLAPAMSLSRHNVVDAIKQDGTRTTTGQRFAWVRHGLVVGEVALCMLLLVSAGLLIQTFIRMRAIDPGFDPENVLTARMSLQGERYESTADVNRFFGQALERIRGIPGVQSAAVVNGVPIERGLNLNVDVLDGPESIERAVTDWRYASIEYFDTMRIPIVSGRGFNSGDRAGAPPVTVVNEEFAKRFLKGTSPIGHHVRVFRDDGSIEIVGVARDLREGRINGRPIPLMYVPVDQANLAGIRASHTYFSNELGRPHHVAADRRHSRYPRGNAGNGSKATVFSVATMDEVKAASMSDQTFQMTLLSGLAAVGLLLAFAESTGSSRTWLRSARESLAFASRLGHRGHGFSMTCCARRSASIDRSRGWNRSGLTLNRSLQSFVYGVSTLDPFTYGSVAVLLIGTAALASFIPALRAVRLNPVAALRD